MPNEYGDYEVGQEPEIPRDAPNVYGDYEVGVTPPEPSLLEEVQEVGEAIVTPVQEAMVGGLSAPQIGEVSARINRNVLEFVDLIGKTPAAVVGGLEGLRTLVTGGSVDDAVRSMNEVRGAMALPSAREAVDAFAQSDIVTSLLGPQATTEGGMVEDPTERAALQMGGDLATAAAGMRSVPGRDLARMGDAAAEFLGFGTAAPVVGAVPAMEAVEGLVRRGADVVEGAARPATEAAERAGTAIAGAVEDLTPRGQARRAAEVPLMRGSEEVATAGFRLDDAGRVVADPAQQRAMSAGVRPGVVSLIRSRTPAVRARMREMVDMLEAGRKSELEKVTRRPSDVIGRSIAERTRAVLRANRAAGSEINKVANRSLRGQEFDPGTIADDFVNSLADEGVYLVDDALDFSQSSLARSKKDQKLVENVYQDLKSLDNRDAFGAHVLKRQLDNMVSYGKRKRGLSGGIESRIKAAREAIDTQLDQNFSDYNQVNTVYANTREALDNMQRSAGTRIDLTGEGAESALGSLSRSLLSNNRSRVELTESIQSIAQAAEQYGGAGAMPVEDIMSQVAFANELERLFGAFADTGFRGDVTAGAATAARDVATEGFFPAMARRALTAIEESGRVSEEDQIQALRQLLKD